jgi:hypothetical protein
MLPLAKLIFASFMALSTAKSVQPNHADLARLKP